MLSKKKSPFVKTGTFLISKSDARKKCVAKITGKSLMWCGESDCIDQINNSRSAEFDKAWGALAEFTPTDDLAIKAVRGLMTCLQIRMPEEGRNISSAVQNRAKSLTSTIKNGRQQSQVLSPGATLVERICNANYLKPNQVIRLLIDESVPHPSAAVIPNAIVAFEHWNRLDHKTLKTGDDFVAWSKQDKDVSRWAEQHAPAIISAMQEIASDHKEPEWSFWTSE
jgi:hypothetical protein